MKGLIESCIPLFLFLVLVVFLFSLAKHDADLYRWANNNQDKIGFLFGGYLLNSLLTDIWVKTKGSRTYVANKD